MYDERGGMAGSKATTNTDADPDALFWFCNAKFDTAVNAKYEIAMRVRCDGIIGHVLLTKLLSLDTSRIVV